MLTKSGRRNRSQKNKYAGHRCWVWSEKTGRKADSHELYARLKIQRTDFAGGGSRLHDSNEDRETDERIFAYIPGKKTKVAWSTEVGNEHEESVKTGTCLF